MESRRPGRTALPTLQTYSEEIEELDKQIIKLHKDMEKAEELAKKVDLVKDQVEGWC